MSERKSQKKKRRRRSKLPMKNLYQKLFKTTKKWRNGIAFYVWKTPKKI